MKKAILILSAVFMGLMATQAKDIFKKYGFKKEILTLSKGKYQEVFRNDEVVQIGTVLLNTKMNKVVKLLQEDTTKNSYKSEFSSRFLTIDPLAEKYYSISPYAFCSNNPVNRIDPDGRADFWLNGKVIGNNGVDDNRVYTIKTTDRSFGSEDNNSLVAGAGLSKADMKSTVSFITENSGNADAFSNNNIAYTNSIEIEGSASTRQDMVNIVSLDNGRGGMGDANNREYGGSVKNGVVTAETPGPVSSPGNSAQIELPSSGTTFHSHPSGSSSTNSANSNTFGTGAVSSFGGTATNRGYQQSPSPIDVTNAGNNTRYVYGRGNNVVYVYNGNGVQAVIPMRNFVTPRTR